MSSFATCKAELCYQPVTAQLKGLRKYRRTAEGPEKRPSRAKARVDFKGIYGTTKAVPFQNIASTVVLPQPLKPCPDTKLVLKHALGSARVFAQFQFVLFQVQKLNLGHPTPCDR
jgi:hypothetical protein